MKLIILQAANSVVAPFPSCSSSMVHASREHLRPYHAQRKEYLRIPTDMTLCSKCLGLDISSAWTLLQTKLQAGESSIKNVKLEGWHSTGKAVFASAAECNLCELICDGWRSHRQLDISVAISQKMFNPKTPPEDLYDDISDMPVYVDSSVHVKLSRRPRLSGCLQAWTPVLFVKCLPGVVGTWEVHDYLVAKCRISLSGGTMKLGDNSAIGRPVPPDPISAEAINTAKLWLQSCSANHKSCRSNSSHHAPPTRILDIDDGVDVDRIFLRDTVPERDYHHVALSHCWGKGNQLCTTSATIQAHREGILIDILPKTFKDAVRFVRALGLRYLWIDSLCIVQDDLEDWRREAGRMADVYRNAHFVLAASRSRSDQEGFLDSRVAPKMATLPTNSSESSEFLLTIRSPMTTDNGRPFDREPLNERAWCLQERWLARRILYHCSEQMFWECAEIGAAENGEFAPRTGDQISPIERSASISKTVFNEILSRGGESGRGSSGDHPSYLDWYEMVEGYTARDITKDSDRLPALRGLEKMLSHRTGDELICGIWRNGFAEGLIWCQATSERSLTRPNISNATSWSWTSVRGPVQFPIYNWHERRCAWKTATRCDFERLVSWYVDAGSVDGPVVPEELFLEGPIVPVRGVQPRPIVPPACNSFDIGPERSTVADRVFAFSHVDAEGKSCCVWLDGGFDVKGEQENIRVEDLRLLFLTRLPFVSEYDFVEHRFGLVLQTLSHPTRRNCYKRVGFIDGAVLVSSKECLADTIPDVSGAITLVFQRPRQEGDMRSKNRNRLALSPFKDLKQQVIIL